MSGPRIGRRTGGTAPTMAAMTTKVSGKAMLLSRYFSLRPVPVSFHQTSQIGFGSRDLTHRKANSKSTTGLCHDLLHRLEQRDLGPLLSLSTKSSIKSKLQLVFQCNHEPL